MRHLVSSLPVRRDAADKRPVSLLVIVTETRAAARPEPQTHIQNLQARPNPSRARAAGSAQETAALLKVFNKGAYDVTRGYNTFYYFSFWRADASSFREISQQKLYFKFKQIRLCFSNKTLIVCFQTNFLLFTCEPANTPQADIPDSFEPLQ